MKNIYYVYAHLTENPREIFYIGKGKNGRAFSKRNRNKYWQNVILKNSYIVEFIHKNLTEEEAFSLEKQAILQYSPRTNLTIGGEGTSGFKHSSDVVRMRNENNKRINKTPEGKLIKSLAQKEAQNRPEVKLKVKIGLSKFREAVKNGEIPNPWKAKKWTPEQIEAIASKQRGEKGYWYGKVTAVAKPVINLDNNQVFQSLREAAKSVNGNEKSLAKAIKAGRPFKKVRFTWHKGQ